jgi:hypothetical protein
MLAQPEMPAVQSALAGCILQRPAPWPGLVQLLETSDEAQYRLLGQMPGFYSYRGNVKKGIAPGYFIPQSLIDMGTFPGLLWGYPVDPNTTTPMGGRLMREHQLRSVTFLRQITPQREGAILGADMGLGKCTTSLQALHLDDLLSAPGIICGPLSAAAAWCGPTSDASRFYGLDVIRVEGRKNLEPEKLIGHKHIFVNYDIIEAWMVWLTSALEPAWIIFDEIHLLMHATADRSDVAATLSRWHTIQCRIGLSGTPIPKYRMDLWNPLRCVQPRQWGDKPHLFGMRYCDGRREVAAGTGDDERTFYTYSGESNDLELRARLAGALLWYTRNEVAIELPKLERRVVHLQPKGEELTLYHKAATNIIKYIKEEVAAKSTAASDAGFDSDAWAASAASTIAAWLGDDYDPQKLLKQKQAAGAIRLKALTTLCGLLSEFKAERAVDEVIRLYANHSHIVVFTWRRESAAHIVTRLQDAIDTHMALCEVEHRDPGRVPQIFGPVDGSMKQVKRQELAQQFAASPCGVYVATLGAAGISINELSAASAALFVDLHWNPSTLTQAESRVHRDGSPHSAVESVFLVVPNTVDDLFIKHLTQKAQAAAGIKQGDLVDVHLVADLSPACTASPSESLDYICALLAGKDDLA